MGQGLGLLLLDMVARPLSETIEGGMYEPFGIFLHRSGSSLAEPTTDSLPLDIPNQFS